MFKRRLLCLSWSRYDDGGYSGGSTDRPDLQRPLDDIRARKTYRPPRISYPT